MTSGLDRLTRVDLSGTSTVSWPRTIFLSDYNVTATTSTDQSAAFQLALNDVVSGTVLIWDIVGTIRIDNTLLLLDRNNIGIVGIVPHGFSPDLSAFTHQIQWFGANGGTMLRIDRVRNSIFRDFGLFCSNAGGANGADKAIFLTQDGAGSNISTRDTFERIFFHCSSTRAGWIGLDIENASGTNNEQHIIHDCGFVGGNQGVLGSTGIAIHLGHSNVKDIIVSKCQRIGLAQFIYSDEGSIRAEYNYGSTVGCVYFGSFSDAITVLGDESESDTQILNATGFGNVPIKFDGCRYADLRGAQVASGTTTTDVILRVGIRLNLEVHDSMFATPTGNFTKNFIQDVSPNQQTVHWSGVNQVSIYEPDLAAGLATFRTVSGSIGSAARGVGGLIIGGEPNFQNSLQGLMSSTMLRALIGLQLDDDGASSGGRTAGKDSIAIGDQGEIEIAGLARPMRPDAVVVGTGGSTFYQVGIIARDIAGNRTLISVLNQTISNANATLSGSNYITVIWPKVPGAVDYLVIFRQSGSYAIAATVTPSGTNVETTNVTANPSFGYTLPGFNETARMILRGSVATPVTATTSAYTAKPSDSFITGDTTAGAYQITLPAASSTNRGRRYTIKKIDASANILTLSGGGTNIDGAATVALSTQWKTYVVRSSGSIWLIESVF